MNVEPFVRVDATPFTASRADVLRARGAPDASGRNGVGLDELDYGDVVYRFQAGGRLEEVTVHAPVVSFGRVAVPFAALAAFVRTQDPASFERAGFLVSPAFGIAFDPACPAWVTALAAHCLDAWRALGHAP